MSPLLASDAGPHKRISLEEAVWEPCCKGRPVAAYLRDIVYPSFPTFLDVHHYWSRLGRPTLPVDHWPEAQALRQLPRAYDEAYTFYQVLVTFFNSRVIAFIHGEPTPDISLTDILPFFTLELIMSADLHVEEKRQQHPWMDRRQKLQAWVSSLNHNLHERAKYIRSFIDSCVKPNGPHTCLVRVAFGQLFDDEHFSTPLLVDYFRRCQPLYPKFGVFSMDAANSEGPLSWKTVTIPEDPCARLGTASNLGEWPVPQDLQEIEWSMNASSSVDTTTDDDSSRSSERRGRRRSRSDQDRAGSEIGKGCQTAVSHELLNAPAARVDLFKMLCASTPLDSVGDVNHWRFRDLTDGADEPEKQPNTKGQQRRLHEADSNPTDKTQSAQVTKEAEHSAATAQPPLNQLLSQHQQDPQLQQNRSTHHEENYSPARSEHFHQQQLHSSPLHQIASYAHYRAPAPSAGLPAFLEPSIPQWPPAMASVDFTPSVRSSHSLQGTTPPLPTRVPLSSAHSTSFGHSDHHFASSGLYSSLSIPPHSSATASASTYPGVSALTASVVYPQPSSFIGAGLHSPWTELPLPKSEIESGSELYSTHVPSPLQPHEATYPSMPASVAGGLTATGVGSAHGGGLHTNSHLRHPLLPSSLSPHRSSPDLHSRLHWSEHGGGYGTAEVSAQWRPMTAASKRGLAGFEEAYTGHKRPRTSLDDTLDRLKAIPTKPTSRLQFSQASASVKQEMKIAGWAASESPPADSTSIGQSPNGEVVDTSRTSSPAPLKAASSATGKTVAVKDRAQQNREKMKRYAARVKRQREALNAVFEELEKDSGLRGIIARSNTIMTKEVSMKNNGNGSGSDRKPPLSVAALPSKGRTGVAEEEGEETVDKKPLQFATAAEKLNYQKRESKARKRSSEQNQLDRLLHVVRRALGESPTGTGIGDGSSASAGASAEADANADALKRVLHRCRHLWDDLIEAERRSITSATGPSSMTIIGSGDAIAGNAAAAASATGSIERLVALLSDRKEG